MGALSASSVTLFGQSTAPPIIVNAPGVVQAQVLTSKAPKVNVLDTDFAGGADPTGINDSTAAVAAAVQYAQSAAGSTNSVPVIYFPRGTYKISNFPKMGTAAPSIEGDGSTSTLINTTAVSGDVLEYVNAGQAGHIHLSGFSLAAQGHLSAADLVEITSTINFDMRDVRLANTGGICLNVQGAERGHYADFKSLSRLSTATAPASQTTGMAARAHRRERSSSARGN